VLAVALAGALVVASAPERMLVRSPKATQQNPQYEGVRLVRNDYDRTVYADRGAFYRDGTRPYTDAFSEYPPLATYLFAIPWTVTRDVDVYRALFTGLMAAALGLAAIVVARLAGAIGASPWCALLLLLPGTLYVSLNFFDIAPTGAALLALLLLLRRRFVAAHAALAVGFLLKAYPLVYLPAFFVWTIGAAGAAEAVRALAGFVAPIAVTALHLAWWSGGSAVIAPFRHQMSREDNAESLYHMALLALPYRAAGATRALFLALQALPGLAAGALRPTRASDLVRALTAAVLAFVLFSRFQSPQWVVWITPLAVLAARSRRELALVAAQDVASYLYFPLAYDRFGPQSPPFAFCLGLVAALRLMLLGAFLWPDNRFRDAEAPAHD
jgi:hypothetical protein